MADQKCLITELQAALGAMKEGQIEDAIVMVTTLKPQASQVTKELEQAQEKLRQLEDSYHHQQLFLSHYVKKFEKKERELVISKSISESIQRTQQKKLQASKWDLMKARNALFLAQKKLRLKERELNNVLVYGLFILDNDSESLEDLKAAVQKVQSFVNKLETDCSRKEHTLHDIQRKISELAHKHKLASKETKNLREVLQSREKYTQRIRQVEGVLKQAASLWTLCKKAFDNGCKREDVMKSIARQAKEKAVILYENDSGSTQESVIPALESVETLTTTSGLVSLLQFNPQCVLCAHSITPHVGEVCFKCEHCSERDPKEMLQSQSVVVESFTCSAEGTIQGIVSVANIAYDKSVLVRYSQDRWVSSRNIKARYQSSTNDFDRFDFQLPFNITTSLCLEFAVQYQVAGGEFWDNNGGKNYRVDFS